MNLSIRLKYLIKLYWFIQLLLIVSIAQLNAANIISDVAWRCFSQIWLTATTTKNKRISGCVLEDNFNYTKISHSMPTHLSNDGSLLNISVGTVAGASGTIPMSDCFDCKCLSTSSAVIWPSVIVSVLMTFGGRPTGFFCVCFLRFGGFAFLFWAAFDALFFRLEHNNKKKNSFTNCILSIQYQIIQNRSLYHSAFDVHSLSNIFGATGIIFRWFGVIVTLRFRILWLFVLQQTVK